MNDGITRALLNTGAFSSGQASNPQIKLLELPAALQKQSVITGDVIASKDGQITLKTPQGNVVFEADVAVAVGQKITLKLQVVVQNAQRNLLVELSSVAAQPTKPQAIPVTTTPLPSVQTALMAVPPAVTQPTIRADNMAPLLNDALPGFPSLQGKIIELPKTITTETLMLLVKEMLSLPLQKPLPPTLQEGLDKIKQLMPLMAQFTQAPNAAPPALPINTQSEQQILVSLLQLMQGTASTDTKNQTALSSWPVQNISLLQTINPGEKITRETVSGIVSQLQATIPQDPDAPAQPIPATALVLGQKNVPSLQQNVVPTLLLGFAPDSPQALIFVTAMPKSSDTTPLLPGTVLVAALPQTKAEPIAVPFSALLNTTQPSTLTPLHPSIGDIWPALNDVWNDILAQQFSSPETAAALRQTIPMPSAQQLPATVLLFMAALRLGTPENWLGSHLLEKLQNAEKSSLINQLTRDMQAIRSAMSEGAADVWRPLPMPLQVGNELIRMQWFYRHQYEDLPRQNTSEDEAENQKRRKTRFILDVPQTRLGDIQIDGLMHEKNLDLILRTEKTIASEMEKAIRGRYSQVLETTGIVGGISFQSGRQQYVKV